MTAAVRRRTVAQALGVVAVATCVAMVAASRDAHARAMCKPVPGSPKTVVQLRDATGRIVATMTAESCGPSRTDMYIWPKVGSGIDDSEDFVTMRRGTCRGQSPPVLYHGHGGFVLDMSATRFARTSFVVESFRLGDGAAAACGAHVGTVPLQHDARESPGAIIGFRRSGKGYLAGPPLGSTTGPVAVRLMPMRGGKTTLVTLGRSQSVGSGGGLAWLRPGSCRRHERGAPIYLKNVQPEYPEGPPTSTRVDVPLEKIAARPFALEIDNGTGRVWGVPDAQWCYEF